MAWVPVGGAARSSGVDRPYGPLVSRLVFDAVGAVGFGGRAAGNENPGPVIGHFFHLVDYCRVVFVSEGFGSVDFDQRLVGSLGEGWVGIMAFGFRPLFDFFYLMELLVRFRRQIFINVTL